MSRSALIVATDTYEDPKLRGLRAPADDAGELARVLGDPQIGEFDVTLCLNPKEHELRRTLSTFFADRRPDDVLLLHFGCHGVKDDDGRLYFAAADTELEHLDATAVPAEFVNRRMNDSRSKRVMLFLDCCYSGAFAAGMTARAGEKVDVKERFEGSGRVVLTASNAMEYSFEGANRHGDGRRSVFTSALVRGLETGEADRDQDHWISVEELYDYVFEHVREDTPNQTPGKWSFVQGDIYVARSSYVAAAVAEPPSAPAPAPAPVAAPAPAPAAAPERSPFDAREWAALIGAAAALSFVAGLPAGELFVQADQDTYAAWIASGAFGALALMVVALLFGRCPWPAAKALSAAFLLGAAFNWPVAIISAAATQSGIIPWTLFGLLTGFAATIPLGSGTTMRNAALLGGVAATLCGVALDPLTSTSHAYIVFVYFALPSAIMGAAIAVAIALAPRVTKPGA